MARAVELGVTYFDTAPVSGGGLSEVNLGAARREIGAEVVVGTKVRPGPADPGDLEGAIVRSVEASLMRLRREALDLIQLHNFVAGPAGGGADWVSATDVARAVAVFERLGAAGKVRAWGINGLGDIAAVKQCLALGVHSVQVCYNLLNPTAGTVPPADFPFEDQGRLIDEAAAAGIGVLAIRVLAGGALGGTAERPANASAEVDPIASGASYADDRRLAARLGVLVEEAHAASLPEAAIRFAAGRRGVASAIVGIATLEQLEEAAAAVARGPLPPAAEARLRAVWNGFGGRVEAAL